MTDTSSILIRIFEASDELEYLLGDSWPRIREELFDLILRLSTEGETVVLRQRADALLAQLLTARAATRVQEFVREIRNPAAASGPRSGGIVSSNQPALEVPVVGGEGEVVEIPVFYATDREEKPASDVEERYTGERGTLRFGLAKVSIPRTHQIGAVETPRWWRFEFKADPSRHVVLLEIETMERAQFVATLKGALASTDAQDVLLYVHGYSVKFADAVRRTAQMAYDLRFPGRTVLFSWPSKGGKIGYPADEATVERSIPHIEEFLRLLMSETGATTVHLISHSMGTRAVARAIERFDPSRLPPKSATLQQIIFAAPDIDRDVFLQIAATFGGRAERFTLYASHNDVALKLSKTLHQGSRAGEAGDGIVIMEGIDTIDASDADTSLFGLGHSYYAGKRTILGDIFTLLTNRTAPGKRFELMEYVSPQGTYWRYRP